MRRCRFVLCLALVLAASSAAVASPAQALVPDGADGWFWQMPQPASNLNDVTFAAAADVFAVGDDGIVLHSTDSGATWAAQPTGTNADLQSVSFTSAEDGWACGLQSTAAAPGVILATTDGGTWVDKTPSGLTEKLSDASFVDAAHGWIGTRDGHVLKTTDAGDTWQTLKVAATYKGFVTVAFVDATHGWAGGTKGRIWRTANGGATWTAQSSGLTAGMQVSQLDFADRAHGWALAESQSSGVSAVLFTSDGGRRWARAARADAAATGLHADGASGVWLVSTEYGGYAPGAANPFSLVPQYGDIEGIVLQHTSDGGAHWQTTSLGSPSDVGAVASAGDAVCAVGEGILVSADGGATWQSATSGQQYMFVGADALSATDIWAVDEDGALLHSTDGGRWVEQTDPATPVRRWANELTGVSFADPADGWVVGNDIGIGGGGVILHTSDGGASWAPQTSNLAGGLTGVQFVDAADGWAISNNPYSGASGSPDAIEDSTNGGATWHPDYVANDAALNALDFASDTTGWVAGSYQPSQSSPPTPAIFATTDRGITWTPESLPAVPGDVAEVTALQFSDALNGWASGFGLDLTSESDQETYLLLHTTDGGSNWALAPSPAEGQVWSICFSDPAHGWLGDEDGVLATTDGGATWQRVAGGSAPQR